MAISNKLESEYIPLSKLKAHKRTIRKIKKTTIQKAMNLLELVGFKVPVVIDKNGNVIVGQLYVHAAEELKYDEIPVQIAEDLTDEQVRILRIAYDRLSDECEFDKNELSAEFKDLLILNPDLDLTVTGCEVAEIDFTLEISLPGHEESEEIVVNEDCPCNSKLGEVWESEDGRHRVYCGDSLKEESLQMLMGNDKAQMVFTDHPYNCKINGHVSGLGKSKHSEFAQASGEMTDRKFSDFLTTSFTIVCSHIQDGSILYACMDWRNAALIQMAAESVGLEHKNTVVWVKDNGGMGSLYRSQHEFILVFKFGKAPHINNIELGKHGRYRTNVWHHPGCNTFRKGRDTDLAAHPTVKPTALVAEAIKDCSKRNGVILDPFGGSGTTLLACEKTGRKARLIEIEPKYVDVTIRRWQKMTGKKFILASTGQSFDEIEALIAKTQKDKEV